MTTPTSNPSTDPKTVAADAAKAKADAEANAESDLGTKVSALTRPDIDALIREGFGGTKALELTRGKFCFVDEDGTAVTKNKGDVVKVTHSQLTAFRDKFV